MSPAFSAFVIIAATGAVIATPAVAKAAFLIKSLLSIRVLIIEVLEVINVYLLFEVSEVKNGVK
jgi:hypothetical protein